MNKKLGDVWEESNSFTVNPWSESNSFTVNPYESDSASIIVYDEEKSFAGYGSLRYGDGIYGDTAIEQEITEIEGVADAGAEASIEITLGKHIEGEAEAGAESSLELYKTTSIEGAAEAAQDMDAELYTEKHFELEAEAGAEIQGDLSINRELDLELKASNSSDAGLEIQKTTLLQPEAAGSASVDGDINTETYLSGEVNASGSVDADITRSNLVEAEANGGADASLHIHSDRSVLLDLTADGSADAELDLTTTLDTSDFDKFDIRKMHSTARRNALAFIGRVDDPADRPVGEFIYMDAPRAKAQDFGGYPYIILEEYTLNDTSNSVNGMSTNYDLDIEIHVVGTRDGFEDIEKFDAINDQITALVKGPRSVLINRGAELGNLQFLRQNRLPGIEENDQPVIRQEYEIRGKLHINPER